MAADALAAQVDDVTAKAGFSGVVRVDRGDEVLLERAAGWAHRAHRVAMRTDTRLAMASGSKGLTALVVLTLDADGTLPLTTPARDLLGADLPLIDSRVTVEHLLAHRSGIGDYIDEKSWRPSDFVLRSPVHRLAETTDFLTEVDGFAQVFPPGTRFEYNNAAFVVLALLAERATGSRFRDLVAERVCAPAGMTDTAYLRSDELPANVASGYLAATGDRTNVLHLPVRGSGDGGAYTTVSDVHRLWGALTGGAVLHPARLAAAWQPRSVAADGPAGYGLEFWLDPAGVRLEGYDAGVSFRTVHQPVSRTTYTVIGNWSDAAWPVVDLLERLLS